MKAAFTRKLLALVVACGLVAGMSPMTSAASPLDGVMGSEYDAVWDPAAGIWNMVRKTTGEVVTTISAPGPNGEPAQGNDSQRGSSAIGGVQKDGNQSPGPDSTVWTLDFKEQTVDVLANGQQLTNYSMRSAKASFTSDESGDILMQFIDGKGQTKLLSLGEGKNLLIEGTSEALSFEKPFPKNTLVGIGKNARISYLEAASANTIINQGKITQAQLNGGATLVNGASIGTLTVTSSHASIFTNSTASFGTISSVSSSPLYGIGKQILTGIKLNISSDIGKNLTAVKDDDDEYDDWGDEEEVPTVGMTGTINDNITIPD